MPTQTFALTNTVASPGVQLATVYGQSSYYGVLYNSLWERRFAATGTDCSINIHAPDGVLVSIDGGNFALSGTTPSGTYQPVTLFSGLSDTVHQVVIRREGGDQYTGIANASDTISVTGAAPAVALPAGWGNTLTQIDSANVRYEGQMDDAGQGFRVAHYTGFPDPDCQVVFKGTGITSIRYWTYRANQRVTLYVDDVAYHAKTVYTANVPTTPGSLIDGAYLGSANPYGFADVTAFAPLATIASDGQPHNYRLSFTNQKDYILFGGLVTSGTLTTPPANATGKKVAIFGDSTAEGGVGAYTWGSNTTNNAQQTDDSFYGQMRILRDRIGFELFNCARGGTLAYDMFRQASVAEFALTYRLSHGLPVPDLWIIGPSMTNDVAPQRDGDSTAYGSPGYTTADIAGYLANGLKNALAAATTCKVIWIPPLPVASDASNTRTQRCAAVEAAVDALLADNTNWPTLVTAVANGRLRKLSLGAFFYTAPPAASGSAPDGSDGSWYHGDNLHPNYPAELDRSDVIETAVRQALGIAVPVNTIGVTPGTASVAVSGTAQLTAVAYDTAPAPLDPQPTFTWSSSNTAVATVSSSGLVTGVAAGTATITAAAQGKSGASVITVTSGPPLPTPALAPPTVSVSLVAGVVRITRNSPANATTFTLDRQVAGVWTQITNNMSSATYDDTGYTGNPPTAYRVTAKAVGYVDGVTIVSFGGGGGIIGRFVGGRQSSLRRRASLV